MPTRRQFLLNCSALAVTASLAPATVLAARPGAVGGDLRQLTLPVFAAHLNTSFTARNQAGNAVRLRLIQAEALAPGKAHDLHTEKFALRFRGPARLPLAQNTYNFEHRALGRFAMFIAPVNLPGREHHSYEAIFNRIPAAA